MNAKEARGLAKAANNKQYVLLMEAIERSIKAAAEDGKLVVYFPNNAYQQCNPSKDDWEKAIRDLHNDGFKVSEGVAMVSISWEIVR